ncbi:MAG: glycerol-3-phosphate 1-O-acyltransferase PlsY [bacterium]
MSLDTSVVLLILLSYFLGALPFGLILSKLKGIDIRKVGSGNIGATNVYRNMGKTYGILVFILDALKGWFPTYLALQLTQNPWLHISIGIIAIVGHSFSIFVTFKGGKGVATAGGMLLALDPLVFLIIFPSTIIAIKLCNYVAPCSIAAAIITPLLLWVFKNPNAYIIPTSILSFMIILKHKSNIIRLIQGKENKLQ